MTGEELLGLAQGFMSGYNFVDNARAALLQRKRDMFDLEQAIAMAPYRQMLERINALDAQRLFHINQQMDPWRVKTFNENARMTLRLMPMFEEQFKLNNQYNTLNTQANMTTLRLQQARTVPAMNQALAESGRPERVAEDGQGNLYYIDRHGNPLSKPVPADMFQFGLIDPPAGAKAATEHLMQLNLLQAGAALKGGGAAALFAPPDMSMGDSAAPAGTTPEGQKPLQYGDTVYTPYDNGQDTVYTPYDNGQDTVYTPYDNGQGTTTAHSIAAKAAPPGASQAEYDARREALAARRAALRKQRGAGVKEPDWGVFTTSASAPYRPNMSYYDNR